MSNFAECTELYAFSLALTDAGASESAFFPRCLFCSSPLTCLRAVLGSYKKLVAEHLRFVFRHPHCSQRSRIKVQLCDLKGIVSYCA